jgi:hypothetical protein
VSWCVFRAPLTSGDICRLFNADRLTLYAVEDRRPLLPRSKHRPQHQQRFEIAGHVQSIAGCVAMSRQLLNIADVQHAQALQKKFIPS